MKKTKQTVQFVSQMAKKEVLSSYFQFGTCQQCVSVVYCLLNVGVEEGDFSAEAVTYSSWFFEVACRLACKHILTPKGVD